MKRLCLILAYLFLFSQTASAMPLLVGQKVVYRGTVTDLRISAVDGTAFIDNLPLVYSSDFSAGVDGWSAIRGTVSGNIDGIAGQDNVLRMTVDTSSNSHYCSSAAFTTIGKKYSITFKYYIPSTNSHLDTIILVSAAWGGELTNLTTLDSWTTVTKTITASTILVRFYAGDGGANSFEDAGGDDVFYIKDVTISEITPYADGNHQIEIYDFSNRMLKGVLKAAGSSEAAVTDVLVGWDFTSGWSPQYISTIDDSNTFTSSVSTGGVYKNALLTAGALYKMSLDGSTTGTSIVWRDGASSVNYLSAPSTDKYITALDTLVRLRSTSAGTTDITTLSAFRVTAPSSSGCTIVSAKGGEVYNFSYKNASFTYNQASSYYVIIRAIR